MNKDELKIILKDHKLWIEGNGGERADLRHADLRYADLRYADLMGANLDYSVITLSCKDLGIHIDDKLAIQRLYHTLYNVAYSKNVSNELKEKLLTKELVEIANKFHKIGECDEIKAYK